MPSTKQDLATQLAHDLDAIEAGISAALPGTDWSLLTLTGRLGALGGLHQGLYEEALRELDMTPVEERVLGILRGNAADTPGELARLTRQTPAGMTRTLDRLVNRRLVKRDADPLDRRRVRVTLTGSGRLAAERKLQLEIDVLEKAFQGLDARAIERTKKFLDALIERLAKARQALGEEAS